MLNVIPDMSNSQAPKAYLIEVNHSYAISFLKSRGTLLAQLIDQIFFASWNKPNLPLITFFNTMTDFAIPS
jgi:hypothetical protein